MYSLAFLLILGFATCQTAQLCLPIQNVSPLMSNRIVGGQPVDIDSIPYQISLQISGSHICGGSILSKRFIMTASHCVVGMEANWPYYNIRVGSSTNNQGGQAIKVIKFYTHPAYNPNAYWSNDIAVLELQQDIIFGANARPVALPSLYAPLPINSMAVASGWGRLTEGGIAPTQVQMVRIPINDPSVCERAYGANAFNRKLMVCAASVVGGESTCQGDSGGPLVVDGVQYGIVSWAQGCARPNYPTVFAHVSNLREFVSNVVGI